MVLYAFAWDKIKISIGLPDSQWHSENVTLYKKFEHLNFCSSTFCFKMRNSVHLVGKFLHRKINTAFRTVRM